MIYYGYPALINGSRSVDEAATHFNRYSLVVLGDGLQDGRHPNHDATRELIARLPEVRFFGYIDLGVHSPHHAVQNLSISEIVQRAHRWKRMGARGILLDDYGYDFANTRQRQVEAVDALHSVGLSTVANSWDPRHALDGEPGPGNPRGLASPLTSTDYYLYESYLVSQGNWVSFKQWRAKSNTLQKLLRACPVQLLSCTTTESTGLEPETTWQFVYQCAWVEGHLATAWGEPNFSAGDNQAPWRPRPQVPAGRRGQALPKGNSAMFCNCEAGQAVADYASKEFKIVAAKPWWQRWLPSRK